MKTKSIISLLSLSIMGMSIYAGQANSSDYRALTPEETSRLTDALLKQGCRNPKAMKFDVETNLFEAEDAVCEGGRKYDIYLDRSLRSFYRSSRRLPMRYNKAILTATPLVTCWEIRLKSGSSIKSELISTPRFTGPG